MTCLQLRLRPQSARERKEFYNLHYCALPPCHHVRQLSNHFPIRRHITELPRTKRGGYVEVVYGKLVGDNIVMMAGDDSLLN